MTTSEAEDPAELNLTASYFFASGYILRARRFRRLLPYGVAMILFTALAPSAAENQSLNELSMALGIGLCMVGQGWRLWAWGSNGAIGKFAVRSRGPYALMRHPLYVGNFLIVLGLTAAFNNAWAWLVFPLRRSHSKGTRCPRWVA